MNNEINDGIKYIDDPLGGVKQIRGSAWDEICQDRNATIKTIKAALQRRSGKSWSVTGGSGTAWGWIHINAPPARRTFKHRERAGVTEYQANWKDQYEEYDSGEPGNSMSEAETKQLGDLLGIEVVQASGGVGVPASYEYRREYLDRANGKTPSVIAQPYWD